jgi:hypothetical protein
MGVLAGVQLTMSVTIKSLTQLVAILPRSDETEAALRFLNQSDLAKIAPSEAAPNRHAAEYWLGIFRIRQKTTDDAGITTYGFPSFLAALERLPPAEPITMSAFNGAGWFGSFWLNQATELIGFVLVEQRTPAEERDRLNSFLHDMI